MKTHRIMAKAGFYTHQQTGEEKARWVEVGFVGQSRDGNEYRCYYPYINWAGLHRDAGSDIVFTSEFEVDDQQGNGRQAPQRGRQQQAAPSGGGRPPARRPQRGRTDGYEDARNSNPAGGEHFDDDIPF